MHPLFAATVVERRLLIELRKQRSLLLHYHVLIDLVLTFHVLPFLAFPEKVVVEQLVRSAFFVEKVLVLLREKRRREDSPEVSTSFLYKLRSAYDNDLVWLVLRLHVLFQGIRQEGLFQQTFGTIHLNDMLS